MSARSVVSLVCSLPVHLNLDVRGLKASPALAIHERCARLQKGGRTVYKLGLAQSPFPVPALVAEALRANAFQKDYLPVRGLRELRDAVAGYHQRRHGIDCNGDHVLVGPGSKELMFLLQLAYYGDVVIPTPAWASYAPQAQILARHVFWLATRRENNWRLTPEELDRFCRRDPTRPRLLILNYPSSPTGATCDADELEALARVARTYGLIVLSDEIYSELHHEGRHVSIARFYPEGTIISGGLSKWCGAGGWRLGTFTFPAGLQWLQEAIATIGSETYTSTSAPIQYAAVLAFLPGAEMERYLRRCRRILAALGRHLASRLQRAGAHVVPPLGGFCLFPDFGPLARNLHKRGVWTSRELCERLFAETGVALLAGSDFGRSERELTARLAYVDFDGARALAASQQLPEGQPLNEGFLRSYCGGMLTAVEQLCDWAKS